LNINDIDQSGYFPLLKAIEKRNIPLIESIIEYANAHNTILQVNEKNEDGIYPLLMASDFNNIKIVELLIQYADRHDITLNIENSDKKDIEKYKPNIYKLLIKHYKKHGMNLDTKRNSTLGFLKNIF